ncbi:MAG: MFS transporter [Bacteroidetes bacterium]|nr:MFS transporter [Bacteroidota bacterium]
MKEIIQKKLSESKAARWTVLILVSFLMLCGYFITDVMSPLKSMLEEQLLWTSSDYGLFTSGYGWFNVFFFMLIFGGMILDKKGARYSGVMSAVIMIIGASIKYWAISTHSLDGETINFFGSPVAKQVIAAAFGYGIFGIGVEIAGITASKIIVKWFKGKELALAMGLEMACARIGTGLAIGITPMIATAFSVDGVPSLSKPILMGILLLIIGLISFLVFCVMDVKRDKQDVEGGVEEDEPFRMKDILDIIKIKGFWYIAILCVLFYSAVFPFLKYATDLMVNKFGVEQSLAGLIPSILPFGTILLTPLFGNMYDRKGKGASIMIFGAIMLICIHLLFSLPFITNWVFAVILTILLGVAFSLVPSAMWPSVPKIIPISKLGTAYALIFWIQNWGLMGVPLLIGNVLDKYCKIVGPDGATIGYNYTIPMLIFTSFGVLALIFAILLKMEDKKKGYGLELPNINK